MTRHSKCSYSVLSLALALAGCAQEGSENEPIPPTETDDEPTAPPPPDEAVVSVTPLRVLTYNVAGLPQGVSGSDPEANTPRMSPLLNDYDIALVQEDFSFHAELAQDAEHPHKSVPMAGGGIENALGDGLNRFSTWPFTDYERSEWDECSGFIGGSSDCLTPKGFSFARHSIGGVEVDVYNLHMDAGRGGDDIAARAAQVEQLSASIADRSDGRALIIAGDTNLKNNEDDTEILENLFAKAGVEDACRRVECPEPERIDRVFFRSAPNIGIEPVDWAIDTRFVDDDGDPLSDHDAVAVVFELSVLE